MKLLNAKSGHNSKAKVGLRTLNTLPDFHLPSVEGQRAACPAHFRAVSVAFVTLRGWFPISQGRFAVRERAKAEDNGSVGGGQNRCQQIEP
jgi:hypothetical protein